MEKPDRRSFAGDLGKAFVAGRGLVPYWASVFLLGIPLIVMGLAVALASTPSGPLFLYGVVMVASACVPFLCGAYLWKTRPTWSPANPAVQRSRERGVAPPRTKIR